MIWKKQADRLNITLTDDDVRKAFNHEAGGDVLPGGAKDAEKLRNLLPGAREMDPKTLFAALRDEFRVRLAQETLLGTSSGARAALGTGLASDEVPAGTTPDQFWDYFKDKRTELKVDFLRIPVSQFTDQVKEVPSEEELKDLFKRYKNERPDPERSTPGFTVPPRAKVEWVAANPDTAHFRDEAAKVLPYLDGARAVGSFLAGAGSLGGVPGVQAALGTAIASNLPLQAEYAAQVGRTRSWWDAHSPGFDPDPDRDNPFATGLHNPDTVTAVLGQVLGTAATGGTPLSGLSVVEMFVEPTTAGPLGQRPASLTVADTAGGTTLGVAVALKGNISARLIEHKAREARMILAGVNPFPLAVAAQQAALSNVPVPRVTAISAELMDRARGRLAQDLARGALDTFVKDLEAKRSDPKAAAEFVKANATPEHGITGHGVMSEWKSEVEIANDPALAPLRRAQLGRLPATPADARDFASTFFRTTQPYKPEAFRVVGDTRYHYWLTDYAKPYEPKFDEARPLVEKEWKFDKARKLARQKAQQVIDAVKGRAEGISADRFFRDEAERLKESAPAAGYERFEFEADPYIAKLVPDKRPLPGDPTRYGPYRIDTAKFPSPRSDTVEELFNALKEPGDATILRDRPDRNYYVALLAERKVPTESEFLRVYEKAPRDGTFIDGLWSRFLAEREEQYRTALVRHLRKQAEAPLDDQDNYDIKPGARQQLRGSTEE
jgi:hypothetical protein